jgi:hypothetical protein
MKLAPTSWNKFGILLLTHLQICCAFAAESDDNNRSANLTKNEVIEETALGMNVTGNKELPNMLYIIPWQEKQADISEPQIRPMLREIFEPLDPDTFNRKLKLYQQLKQSHQSTAKQQND